MNMPDLPALKPNNHPDFVGGIVWTEMEMDAIRKYALAYAAQCLEAAEDRIRALRDSHCRDANCSTNGLDCNYVCAWNDAIEILRAAQKGTA